MTTNDKNSENVDPPVSVTSNFTNFSIDHILNRAGENCKPKARNECNENVFQGVKLSLEHFSWLQCTRYCPPKIPRNQKKDTPQRRQMGRHPRIPFTSQQLHILEEKFQHTPYLTGEEVMELAKRLQLADIRVKIWFQNRRARDRREKLTSETNKLSPSSSPKSSHTDFRNSSSSSHNFRISHYMDEHP
ncbi:homeobox protein engrailed-2b [Harmonia axyridis]|uniref:homeobox protein engrailed-2b n=1 Tax=Harmonia axyridis TaxID=115357 RepID=UPI001E279078|nr:homeobox protein engrailed-2b [Harmonia axyridis]